jgi:hypothetical protein
MNHCSEEKVHSSHTQFMHPFGAVTIATATKWVLCSSTTPREILVAGSGGLSWMEAPLGPCWTCWANIGNHTTKFQTIFKRQHLACKLSAFKITVFA